MSEANNSNKDKGRNVLNSWTQAHLTVISGLCCEDAAVISWHIWDMHIACTTFFIFLSGVLMWIALQHNKGHRQRLHGLNAVRAGLGVRWYQELRLFSSAHMQMTFEANIFLFWWVDTLLLVCYHTCPLLLCCVNGLFILQNDYMIANMFL